MLAPYRDRPAAFIHDFIVWRGNDGPTAYQAEILDAIPLRKRVSVRGPHGLGKTTIEAWALLWFALTREGQDWKVPTTASAWRQLTKFLWPEVRKWARRLNWDKLARDPFDARLELQSLSLKLSTGEAFATASDTPEMIEGAHADSLLYLFDESKAIPAGIFDAAEGAFSNAGGDGPSEAFALACSTPGDPEGRFYELHQRRPGTEDWWVRHVTLDETIAAGRVSREWAEQRARQWSTDSAVYQNRVLGEFAAGKETGIIPLAWIEAANERWHAWNESGRPGAVTRIGVDVGGGGDDPTVMAFRAGNVITELRRSSNADTMVTAGLVKGALDANPDVEATIDVIGIGAGIFHRLREQKATVVAFNAAAGTDLRDKSGELSFLNMRAAGWWTLRELLDPHSDTPIALPPDDLLTGDLTAPTWRTTSAGRIQIESKEDIKKRLGRSTDSGDAVMQVFTEQGRPNVRFI